MRTLFVFLLISSSSAFCQQNGFPPYPGYPDETFKPVHEWKDHRIDIEAMGRDLAPLAFQPKSYSQWLEDNEPKFVPPPVTANPIKLRDAQGRVVGSVQTRMNGEVTFRDQRGRVTQTGTLRAGTVTWRDSKNGSARKAK